MFVGSLPEYHGRSLVTLPSCGAVVLDSVEEINLSYARFRAQRHVNDDGVKGDMQAQVGMAACMVAWGHTWGNRRCMCSLHLTYAWGIVGTWRHYKCHECHACMRHG